MADSRTGVRLSQTSPAFLHANSTSHTWAFSAVAEIIDNAYDPDVSASQLFIDVEDKSGQKCLVFMDNGNGCSVDQLHKMLSFGFCEKVEVDGHKPVGHYGNGFKSGSMRLGKDAIVFTKCGGTFSVGFLSQTYLHNIAAQTVLVPMLSWTKDNKLKQDDSTQENLKAITEHSLFKSERELLNEFQELEIFDSGTRILIYNLKRANDGRLELDFDSCGNDIRNSEHQALDFSTTLRPVREHQAEYWKSLREYCSILFLKPRMKIILRGHKVKTKLISKSLSRTEKDYYKPVYLAKPCKIIFGFSDSVDDFGLMMYHRNRLIKAFEHVGCQKQANDHGVGIVGVVELDFLEPIHNKQDFNKTDRYNAVINSLGQKLSDYWYTKTQSGNASQEERRKADWTWVQCENCLKWRRLPDGFTDEGLPDKWFCYMNADPTHNRCDIDEEPEDEDELQAKASYQKVKKKPEPRKNDMLQPLPSMGAPGRPTMADFEAAQKELEMAKQRERQQQQYIERLQQSRKQIQQAQDQIRHSHNNNMNVLNNIGKSGQNANHTGKSPQVVQARNSPIVNGKIRKERITLPGGDVIITKNVTSSSDSEEEKSTPQRRNQPGSLLVKLPQHKKQKKQSSAVIVIDSDDEEDVDRRNKSPTVVDIKPDVDQLNSEMAEEGDATHVKTEKQTIAAAKTANGSMSNLDQILDKVASEGPSPSTSSNKEGRAVHKLHTPKPPRKSSVKERCVNKHTQTTDDKESDNKESVELLQEKLEQLTSKLSSLRNNVGKLLQTILPDLQVDNLEYIDAIVSEMVRVNGDETNDKTSSTATANGAPSSSSSGRSTSPDTPASPPSPEIKEEVIDT